MTRLPSSLLRKAKALDPLLPPLVQQCRDLGTAQNELRWLREHVDDGAKTRSRNTKEKAALLRRLVKDRAAGKPLQYILGSEYFGHLQLRCRPGVLIPRSDTAASVSHLARLLRAAQGLPDELRVLDLCTGTGCIPLLFQHEMAAARDDVQMRLLGVDISEKAIALARENRDHVRRSNDYVDTGKIEFMLADVLAHPMGEQTGLQSLMAQLNWSRKPNHWDILISNPPYISPSAYWTTTERSVRGYEPKLALVPPPPPPPASPDFFLTAPVHPGDEFYPRLLSYARHVEAKVVLLEVADLDQAIRVAHMARKQEYYIGIEIWRDQPAQPTDLDIPSELQDFPIVGSGNGRSVLCWRGPGAAWLDKHDKFLPKSQDSITMSRSGLGEF